MSLDVSHSSLMICLHLLLPSLPTDMHYLPKQWKCWQLQLVEKLTRLASSSSSYSFFCAAEIKSVFNQIPPRAAMHSVCIYDYVRSESCVINIGFCFHHEDLHTMQFPKRGDARRLKKFIELRIHPHIRTVWTKRLHAYILIVMHKRLTIYCTITQ